jgi:MFS family permease
MKNPKEEQVEGKIKIKLSKEVFGLFIVYLLAMMINSTFINYISYVVSESDGSPVLASTIITIMSVASIVIAAAFGVLYKKLRNKIIVVAAALTLLTFAVLTFGGQMASIPLLFVGAVLSGFATNMFGVGVPMMVTTRVPTTAVAAALSFAVVFQNGGSFFNSPFLQLVTFITGTNAPSWTVFFGAAVASIILIIIAVVVCIAFGRRESNSNKTDIIKSN